MSFNRPKNPGEAFAWQIATFLLIVAVMFFTSFIRRLVLMSGVRFRTDVEASELVGPIDRVTGPIVERR